MSADVLKLPRRRRRKSKPRAEPAEIITQTGIVSRLDGDPKTVLLGALNDVADLQHVTVVGCRHDGSLFFRSSKAGAPDVVWDFEVAKLKLLKIVEGAE